VSRLKPNGSKWVLWRRRLSIALVVGVSTLLASAWIAGSLLVHPTNHVVSKPYGFSATSVSIAGQGHAIAGWWTDGGSNTPVVLLLHGVRDDRASMVPRAQLLGKHGFSVLLIDLQGHGETPGEAISFGARESADVTAALAWVKHNAPGRRVGVIGCSLGGASVLLAPQPTGFDAIVLEAVYPRITRAVENRVHLFVGPLATLLSPLLLLQLAPRLNLSTSDLEPIKSIGRLGAPVLVAAGSNDRHTTLAESVELYDAAASPKQFWVVQGAGHQDFLAFDARGYQAHVVQFMLDNLRVAAQ
jgi:alpha-beta hydrolase superfamily lysophospholipase